MVYSWKVLFCLTILLVTISNQTIHVNAQTFLSPLKQLESGIKIQDIKCKEGLVLIIKESNVNPSCVKPTSEQRLLSHGWIIPKFEAMQVNHNETVNTVINENVMPTVNSTNNTTGINDTDNGTITESMIDKWYHEMYVGNRDPNHKISGGMPLPILQVTPTISSTNPNSIKILMIGMSPNS